MPQDNKGGGVPVAQVEDYDSDESRVVPETVVQAWHSSRLARSQHANLNLKPTDRSSHLRDAATSSRRKPQPQIAPRSKTSIGYSSPPDTDEPDNSAHSSRRPALIRFAEESEDAADGLYRFRNSLPRSATRITAIVSELFAISAALRAIHNELNEEGLSFYRIQEDLRLTFRSLRMTLDELFRMFAKTKELPSQTVWEDLNYLFEEIEKFGLLERLEWYRDFLNILVDGRSQGLGELRQDIKDVEKAQEAALRRHSRTPGSGASTPRLDGTLAGSEVPPEPSLDGVILADTEREASKATNESLGLSPGQESPKSLPATSPRPTWLEERLPSPPAGPAPRLEVPAPSPGEESDSDNDSIFAESVFSQGSFASSATTASISSVPDEMIQDFVSILFCTDELREISTCAINDEATGAQRYQRNIRRLIAQYGRSLTSESLEGDQAGAARMLQSRSISTRAARDIVKQAERSNDGLWKGDLQLMTPPGRIDVNWWMERQDRDELPDGVKMTTVDDSERKESDNVSEESVEDQEDVGAERYDVRALQEFLLQSKAYSEFKTRLVEFVHRSYESRVLRAIGTEILPEDGKRRLGREGIRVVAKDLSWAPVRLISISDREDWRLGDYVKGWVEDKIGETWNWWPLQQVKRPLAPASSRIRWQSPFGTPRHVDIPTRAAKALQQVLSSAPAFVNSQNTGIPAQNSANQNRNGNTGTSAQNGNPGSISGPGKNAGSQQTLGTGSPGCGSASSSSGQVSQVPRAPDPRHVFLCVRRGTSHNFIDMSAHTMRCDAEFFRAVKENYFHLRGWLRRYFSMWQYDRCDFYQFQKFDINKGAPSKESFPPSSNAAYDFLPRPIDPSPPGGPISDQEFRERFYKSCHHCHSWHLHHRERIRNTSTIQHAAKDAIALLPKRKEALQMDDGRREQFWGIYARERRCFAWVLAYGLLFNLPGVIFFFLWLFQWEHASDLQNAAVPVGMSISLTMLFVALLFESREKDRV